MQIVINISEEEYEEVRLHPGCFNFAHAILNGIPLPKGHGELVYREDVCNELRYMNNNGFITRSVNHVVEDIKKGVSTIIEADKEEQKCN